MSTSEGFGGLAAAVQAQMTSAGVPAVPSVPTPAPVAAPVEAPVVSPSSPDPGAPATPPPAPTLDVPTPIPFEFPDDALIDLGRGHIVPARELKQSGFRLSDYTQKTQALAKERTEIRTEITATRQELEQLRQERAELDQFFRSDDAVLGYAIQAFGPQAIVSKLQSLGLTRGQAQAAVAEAQTPGATPTPASPAPPATETVTVQDLQQTVAYLQHQHQQQLAAFQSEAVTATEQQIHQVLQQAEDAKAVAQYEAALDSHIGQLVAMDPYLQATPYVEQIFKFEVMKAQPSTFDELQAVLRSTAQAQVARFQQAELARRKVQVMGGAPSAPSPIPSPVGIEPPGGLPVTPAPQTFYKADGSADWKALGRAAQAAIETTIRQSA